MNILEIIDTSVKIGLGALIAALSGFWIEIYKRKSEYERENERLLRNEIIAPITIFIDNLLTLMSKAYWEMADGKQPNIQEILETIRQREATIEARVLSLSNKDITDHFRKLNSAYSSFRVELGNGKIKETRDYMKEAFIHAGIIFRLIYVTK